ncbi:nucleotidyltransferase family protein [uncultured Ruminococcus sp.]|uniref:nucleotidyltransferase domain-containing protein n=1 Tax=uncultured Ruminococcus sp. TaxID=165186 RepID=UPI0025E00E45|nr:nucleotidyltransferase family protein [uncultured Ruminococcus sp.]
MRSGYKDLICLLACAVNGITPDASAVRAMDIDSIYTLAKAHTLRGCVHIVLEKAGVEDEKFTQAYKKALRKIIYLDIERGAITEEMEKRGIWYMPLKGALLKDLYPENGMREMTDIDMLFDASRAAEMRDIMTARGYTVESYAKKHHDIYLKPPVLNFEMHTMLFDPDTIFHEYYKDPMRLMVRDEGNKFGYHFSDEDFYIFMLAHEYKHYSRSGTGLRSLLDCYVFMKNKMDTLDMEYVRRQTDELGITDFEREQRELAFKVFSSEAFPELSKKEQEMLDYFISSNTYGFRSRAADNTIKRYYQSSGDKSRSGFIKARLFPEKEFMARRYPKLYPCPLLRPLAYIFRWGKGIAVNRVKLTAELKALKRYNKS